MLCHPNICLGFLCFDGAEVLTLIRELDKVAINKNRAALRLHSRLDSDPEIASSNPVCGVTNYQSLTWLVALVKHKKRWVMAHPCWRVIRVLNLVALTRSEKRPNQFNVEIYPTVDAAASIELTRFGLCSIQCWWWWWWVQRSMIFFRHFSNRSQADILSSAHCPTPLSNWMCKQIAKQIWILLFYFCVFFYCCCCAPFCSLVLFSPFCLSPAAQSFPVFQSGPSMHDKYDPTLNPTIFTHDWSSGGGIYRLQKCMEHFVHCFVSTFRSI